MLYDYLIRTSAFRKPQYRYKNLNHYMLGILQRIDVHLVITFTLFHPIPSDLLEILKRRTNHHRFVPTSMIIY